jgi:phosphoglycolate phosphatase
VSQRIIFFDIDGTLLSSGGAGHKAMEGALVEEFRISMPFDGVLTAGRTDFGIVTELFDRYGIDHTDRERSRFRQAYLNHLPECLQSVSGLVLPGIPSLLHQLARRNDVKLALLTGNYSEGAWIKLQHFELDHYFDFGGFGDIHEDRNSVAESAHTTAEAVLNRSIPGRQCCVVGDTPADITCARSIGASVVAVATGIYDTAELSAHEPDHLFTDFNDTDAVVSAIVRLTA